MTSCLPRRPYIGLELAPPASGRPGLPAVRVLPGSMAAAAGIRPGDRLLQIGDCALSAPAEAPPAVRRLTGRARARLAWERDGERHEQEIAVVPLPAEAAPEGCEVLLDEVACGAARLRTIITRPRAATPTPRPQPAVLLLPGLACQSVDFWHGAASPLSELVRTLGAQPLVTLRVERSGLGDSQGPPCAAIDFHTEVAGYRAGLAALRQYPFVDRRRIVLFGHSLGGMIAPLLAAEGAVAGVVVYGTSAWRWSRCMLASLRRQHQLRGLAGEALERRLASYRELYRLLLAEECDPAAALAVNPALAECGDQTFGRSVAFIRQLEQADIAGAWRRLRCPVLAIRGEHDWIVSDEEQRDLAGLVRPQPAEVLTLPGLDHAMAGHSSLEESLRRLGSGPLGPQLPRAIVSFSDRLGRELVSANEN